MKKILKAFCVTISLILFVIPISVATFAQDDITITQGYGSESVSDSIQEENTPEEKNQDSEDADETSEYISEESNDVNETEDTDINTFENETNNADIKTDENETNTAYTNADENEINNADINSDENEINNADINTAEKEKGNKDIITAEKETDNTDINAVKKENNNTALKDAKKIKTQAEVADTADKTKEIKAQIIPVKGITIKKAPSEIATKETVTLNAALTPANTTQKGIIWSSSDESVATVDQTGKITALRYGKAEIFAVSEDNPAIKTSFKINVRYYDVNGSADIARSNYQYYYDPVYWAAEKGITKGYDGVYFGPQRSCERREMMIFLWRLVGSPRVTGNMPFTDVSSRYGKDSDSYKAILWGYKEGIVKGFSATEFRPKSAITRKDALIMLYRICGKPAVSGNISFPDVKAEHYRASSDTYRSILWGYYTRITNGYKDGNFKPGANCLREHIVTFIYRYVNRKNIKLVLDTPKLTGCTDVSKGIKVTWNKVKNATNYVVYLMNGNGSLTKIANTKDTSYTYTKAKSGNVYTFTVVAKSDRVESDYDEAGISNDPVIQLALKRLKAVGGTLKDAYNWSVSIPYQNQPAVYYARGYAQWSFNNLAGDCLGKAATFYMMAKALGYDVRLMYGYVPQRGGGMVDHGWVEIKYNGAWYVCDPDFEYESGRNGYFIYYGQSGTWMYTDYRALNY